MQESKTKTIQSAKTHKKQSAHHNKGGCSNKLAIDGVLLVDKPSGKTSNQVLQIVKRLFNARKAGHTGSLDPLASGMLPICFGKATKFAQYLLDADKHYVTQATLGIMTDTGDMEGEVIQQRPVAKVSDNALDMVLNKFKGPQQQVPPMHSALKHKGQPLYKLARKGINVDRPPRDITIHQLELVERNANTMTIDVICSKGTYIRTLVEDIGKALLCGATVSMLRRINVGVFKDYPMYSLSQLEEIQQQHDLPGLKSLLLPMTAATASLPELILSETECLYLKNGRSFKPVLALKPGYVSLKLYSGKLLGVGEVDSHGKLSAHQLIYPS